MYTIGSLKKLLFVLFMFYMTSSSKTLSFFDQNMPLVEFEERLVGGIKPSSSCSLLSIACLTTMMVLVGGEQTSFSNDSFSSLSSPRHLVESDETLLARLVQKLPSSYPWQTMEYAFQSPSDGYWLIGGSSSGQGSDQHICLSLFTPGLSKVWEETYGWTGAQHTLEFVDEIGREPYHFIIGGQAITGTSNTGSYLMAINRTSGKIAWNRRESSINSFTMKYIHMDENNAFTGGSQGNKPVWIKFNIYTGSSINQKIHRDAGTVARGGFFNPQDGSHILLGHDQNNDAMLLKVNAGGGGGSITNRKKIKIIEGGLTHYISQAYMAVYLGSNYLVALRYGPPTGYNRYMVVLVNSDLNNIVSQGRPYGTENHTLYLFEYQEQVIFATLENNYLLFQITNETVYPSFYSNVSYAYPENNLLHLKRFILNTVGDIILTMDHKTENNGTFGRLNPFFRENKEDFCGIGRNNHFIFLGSEVQVNLTTNPYGFVGGYSPLSNNNEMEQLSSQTSTRLETQCFPSSAPTPSPTDPTKSPTHTPSISTLSPSRIPSSLTEMPTFAPTFAPTLAPTPSPTYTRTFYSQVFTPKIEWNQIILKDTLISNKHWDTIAFFARISQREHRSYLLYVDEAGNYTYMYRLSLPGVENIYIYSLRPFFNGGTVVGLAFRNQTNDIAHPVFSLQDRNREVVASWQLPGFDSAGKIDIAQIKSTTDEVLFTCRIRVGKDKAQALIFRTHSLTGHVSWGYESDIFNYAYNHRFLFASENNSSSYCGILSALFSNREYKNTMLCLTEEGNFTDMYNFVGPSTPFPSRIKWGKNQAIWTLFYSVVTPSFTFLAELPFRSQKGWIIELCIEGATVSLKDFEVGREGISFIGHTNKRIFQNKAVLFYAWMNFSNASTAEGVTYSFGGGFNTPAFLSWDSQVNKTFRITVQEGKDLINCRIASNGSSSEDIKTQPMTFNVRIHTGNDAYVYHLVSYNIFSKRTFTLQEVGLRLYPAPFEQQSLNLYLRNQTNSHPSSNEWKKYWYVLLLILIPSCSIITIGSVCYCYCSKSMPPDSPTHIEYLPKMQNKEDNKPYGATDQIEQISLTPSASVELSLVSISKQHHPSDEEAVQEGDSADSWG